MMERVDGGVRRPRNRPSGPKQDFQGPIAMDPADVLDSEATPVGTPQPGLAPSPEDGLSIRVSPPGPGHDQQPRTPPDPSRVESLRHPADGLLDGQTVQVDLLAFVT